LIIPPVLLLTPLPPPSSARIAPLAASSVPELRIVLVPVSMVSVPPVALIVPETLF
jgi:hypothetical protein